MYTQYFLLRITFYILGANQLQLTIDGSGDEDENPVDWQEPPDVEENNSPGQEFEEDIQRLPQKVKTGSERGSNGHKDDFYMRPHKYSQSQPHKVTPGSEQARYADKIDLQKRPHKVKTGSEQGNYDEEDFQFVTPSTSYQR